ncbi:hypothetical protein H4R34_005819, partial [Dimargaris verticillata]
MPNSPTDAQDPTATSQAEKLRLRRERLEKWRKEREARARKDAISNNQTSVKQHPAVADTESAPPAPEPDTSAATIEHTPAQPSKAAQAPANFTLKSRQITPHRLGFAWKNGATRPALSGSLGSGQTRPSGRIKLSKSLSSAFADTDDQENGARKRPRLPSMLPETELDATALAQAGSPTDPSTITSSDLILAAATEASAMDI